MFLGGMAYDLDGRPLDISPGKKGEALCCYLLCNMGKRFSREYLAELFWADSTAEAARYNLRYTLWLLRRALGEGSTGDPSTAESLSESFIVSTRYYLKFNERSPTEVDSLQFENKAKAVLTSLPDKLVGQEGKIEYAERVLQIYKGDFLKGFGVKTSPEFEDWMLVEKERLQATYLALLEFLIEGLFTLRQYDKAIYYSNRMLAVNPLDETVHRNLIRLYTLTGQRAQAIKQYRICSEILRQELNLTPSPETRNAFAAAMQAQAQQVALVSDNVVGHNGSQGLSSCLSSMSAFMSESPVRAPGKPGVYYTVCQGDSEEFRRLLATYETTCEEEGSQRIRLRAYPQDRVAFTLAAEFVRFLLGLADKSDVDLLNSALSEPLSILAPEFGGVKKPRSGSDITFAYNPILEYRIADAVFTLTLRSAQERALTALITHLEWADEYSLRVFAYLASKLRRLKEAQEVNARIALFLHSSVVLGIFAGL